MRKIVQMQDSIAICDDGTAWIYWGEPDEPWRFAGPIPTEPVEDLVAKNRAMVNARAALNQQKNEALAGTKRKIDAELTDAIEQRRAARKPWWRR